LRIEHQHKKLCSGAARFASSERLFAMNPALRFISSRSFLGLFSLFGLLCSLAVFVLIGLR
jgi:hypothetical protein